MSEMTDMAESITRFAASGVPITASLPEDDVALPLPPIGLSGFAGSGKTVAALYLQAALGYERQHIAEPLRRMLQSLLRDWGMADDLIAEFLTGSLKEAVIPCLGVTSRHAQITLGTEWGRELIDRGLWAKLWSYQARASGKPTMNDSVRFPNEEKAIRAAGGFTVLIKRPGTGPAAFKWKRLGPLFYRWFGCMWGVHDSERIDRLQPDFVMINDGSIADLHERLRLLMRSYQPKVASPSPRA